MIELKQFIKEALLNIVDGVDEANKEKDRFKILGVKHDLSGMEGNFVAFDVTVYMNESSSKGAKGKAGAALLNVVSVGGDAKIDQTNTIQNTHHLAFKIYIKEQSIVPTLLASPKRKSGVSP